VPRAIAIAIVLAVAVPAAAQRAWLAPLEAADPIEVWIAPGAGGEPHPDADLARAAVAAWVAASGGRIKVRFVDRRADARLRLIWVGASGGQYGEMRPIRVKGRRGAEVFVRPITAGMGRAIDGRARRDRLYRDAIVYLTCVHELGHGLGLGHTADFADIMFSFQHGGDIEEYFLRYRRKLARRGDVRKHSGLSPADIRRLRALYDRAPRAPR
jgi:hypothetical protein